MLAVSASTILMHNPLYKVLLSVLQQITRTQPLAIAFSGGVDSRLLAFAALKMQYNPHLVHIQGVHVPPAETAYARAFAQKYNLPCTVLSINPLEIAAIAQNDKKRCYHCKHSLFSQIQQAMQGFVVCDGSHSSDATGYRPGLQALQELGIHSPLAKAKLTKENVRTLAHFLDMEDADQKARPCLFTRFAYNLMPTAKQMQQLAKVEENIRNYFVEHQMDPDFRLRFITENTLELHIQAPFSLSPALHNKLQILIQRDFLKTPLQGIIIVNRLSGFFDSSTN